MSEALGAIAAGWFGVVATLRVQFAEQITLGSSIGDVLTRFASRYLRPGVCPLHRFLVSGFNGE